MLKLSQAMVGHAEVYVGGYSAMLLDLCRKVLHPRSTKILSGFWRAMLEPFWGVKWKDQSYILGLDWGQVWLEATARDLEGKLGYREVMLKLSWAMLCYVEAVCQILFGHVVGFASRHAFPPAGPRFEWVSASYVGSI